MAARTDMLLKGKDVLMLIEKAADTFVPYACISAANITIPGVELETVACRAGTYKRSTNDPELPTVSLESIFRYVATGDAATNWTDAEIYDLVVAGTVKNVKLQFGSKTGDMVLTGPGIFNQQTLNGPQSGIATGAVTFNFTDQPTKTTMA